jgi:hypothetical protein
VDFIPFVDVCLGITYLRFSESRVVRLTSTATSQAEAQIHGPKAVLKLKLAVWGAKLDDVGRGAGNAA